MSATHGRRGKGPERPEVGLCARCFHAACQRNERGSEFWRCRAAEEDPRLLRYPPLPVQRCFAFRPLASGGEDAGGDPA